MDKLGKQLEDCKKKLWSWEKRFEVALKIIHSS